MRTYGLDIETDDPCLKDRGKVKSRGVSWVFGEGEILTTGVYDAKTGAKRAYEGAGGEAVRKLLINPDVEIVGTRIVYDIGWLCSRFGMSAKDVKCSLVDISLVESVIDEYQPYSLDDLAWKYLRERKGSEVLAQVAVAKGLKGDFRRHLKALWEGGHRAQIKDYVLSDADQPVRIWQEQKKVLTENDLWEPAIRKNRLILVTLMMKQRGIKVDVAKKEANYQIAKAAQDRLGQEFTDKYGKININSPLQVAKLFDAQGVPYRNKIRIKGRANGRAFSGGELWDERKRLKAVFSGVRVQKGQLVLYVTKQYAARTAAEIMSYGYAVTNNPSVGAKAIEHMRKTYPVVGDVLELKQVTNIIVKFLGPEFDRFIAGDGRIHADFNISGARQTGRFSSSAPNLQQVPSKTILFRKTDHEVNLARMCRELLVAEEGEYLGKMDYSGQENVLMAHFAVGRGADEVRAQYRNNPKFDFHAYIGEISGLYAEYGPEVGRKYSKNCSFGLGYGMQLQTMMETFGWDHDTAQGIMDAYNDAAPFVRDTMDAVSEVIVRRGYILTLGKKRLHLQRFNGKVDTRSAYKGFNKLIQGSGVDMMEETLVRIYYSGLDDIFPLRLTVHDEIVFSIRDDKTSLGRLGEVKHLMENAIQDSDKNRLSVPIRVDPELGYNWSDVCGEYDSEEGYKKGAKCYRSRGGSPVFYRRVSKEPEIILGVPLSDKAHWAIRRAA
jgi:DNA polymerase I-like protein with 3'-5' exonuclease and polymerase domains